jgi:predicted RND superfamily exporter protein
MQPAREKMMVTFTLDAPLVIQLLVSSVLPLLVGLVTKVVTSPGVKAILLALFTLVASILTELGQALTSGTPYDIGQGLLLAVPAFIVAVGMHYGLWKPTGTSQRAQELFTSKA